MNKTAKHLFRLCVTVRNLRRIPCGETWMSYSRTATLPYSSNSNSNSNSNTKDNGVPLTPHFSGPDKDVILDNLSRASTADEIFEVVKEYRHLLRKQHSIQAFKMLDSMYRMKSITDPSIGKKVEFLQLCEVLSSEIRSLNVNEAVHILKVFSHLGVPTTSVISQSLLQLIRTSLSHLSFHNLLDLEYQLKDFDSTPLADALKIAVPIMCEIQLNNKMIDISDVSQLTDVLLFLCLRPGNHKSVEMVINALRRIGQNMYPSQARKILRHLCDLEYLPPGYEEVVLNVQQVLIKGMTRMTFFDIQKTLGKVVKKVAYQGDKAFYNEEFVDACAKAIISEDYGFEEGIKILKLLYTLGHTQIRLIDYLAAKCFEKPEVLSRCSPSSVMTLIIALASTDYKPIFWESMQDVILKNAAKNEYKVKPILIDYAISMAVFDCFDAELIKIVFTEHFLHGLLSQNRPNTHWNLLVLYQSVKLFCPTYNGPWPPQYILKAAIKANGPYVEKSSLLPILEQAMGGSQYVLNNLKSKIGHHIDHVVVMRKGGYPVAVNTIVEEQEEEPVVYIEDVKLPTESQVIIVFNLPESAYSLNSHRLKGNWSLLLKTLETQTNHTVIPISSIMWNSLSNHEKIPYLMQAIRLKCDSLSASANV